jgi:hypothetical protein
MAITRRGDIITDTTRGKSYKEIDGKIYSLNKDKSVGKRVGFLLEASLRGKKQTKGATKRLNPSMRNKKQEADILKAIKGKGTQKGANISSQMSGSENKALNKIMEASPKKNYNVGVSKGGVPFKEAFAHFRKQGNKTFTWNGKKYTTKLAEEMYKGGMPKKRKK